MSNEKNMQRKWDREEVIILVTEYYKNRNLSAEKLMNPIIELANSCGKEKNFALENRFQLCLEIMQEYVCNQHVSDV